MKTNKQIKRRSLSLDRNKNICTSVRNPISQEVTRERIVIDPSKLCDSEVGSHEKHRSEHASHFSMKWDGGQQRVTIRIFEDDDAIRDIESKANSCFVPILKLDCNGLEPYAFHPLGEEFSIVRGGGTNVQPVDLSSGEWSDYDISYGTSSIKNFESKFQ
jgi:hypothetical protein